MKTKTSTKKLIGILHITVSIVIIVTIIASFCLMVHVVLNDSQPTTLNTQKQIATVNITKIVDDFVKQAAKQSASQEEQQQKVQAFSKKLDTALHELAKKDNLILMPSEAVIVGAEDVTNAIEKKLLLK